MNMHLQDWEKILSPHLSKIELLSEIPLDRAGHMQLEQDLAASRPFPCPIFFSMSCYRPSKKPHMMAWTTNQH